MPRCCETFGMFSGLEPMDTSLCDLARGFPFSASSWYVSSGNSFCGHLRSFLLAEPFDRCTVRERLKLRTERSERKEFERRCLVRTWRKRGGRTGRHPQRMPILTSRVLWTEGLAEDQSYIWGIGGGSLQPNDISNNGPCLVAVFECPHDDDFADDAHCNNAVMQVSRQIRGFGDAQLTRRLLQRLPRGR